MLFTGKKIRSTFKNVKETLSPSVKVTEKEHEELVNFRIYVIRSGKERQLYNCNDCYCCFSETKLHPRSFRKTILFRYRPRR